MQSLTGIASTEAGIFQDSKNKIFVLGSTTSSPFQFSPSFMFMALSVGKINITAEIEKWYRSGVSANNQHLAAVFFRILMEIQSPFFPVLFTFLLFFFMLVKVVKLSRAADSSSENLPGPPKLPVIGNLHQLVSSFPHYTLRDLATQYGSLMHLKLGEVSTIVVSSPEVAKEVLKTHDIIFTQRPQLLSSKIMSYDHTDIGFASDGKEWRQLRKNCMIELLTPSLVQSFKSIREEEASNLIRTINSNEGSLINLSEEFFSLTCGVMSRLVFGKRSKGHDEFLTIFTELTKLPANVPAADLYPSFGVLQLLGRLWGNLETLNEEADRLLQSIVNQHKQSRITTIPEQEAKDLVEVFLKLQEQGGLEFTLTDNMIKAVLFDIFTAGCETSMATIEWAMSEMLKNPRVMKEAQIEVRQVFHGKGNVDETLTHQLIFLKAVISETLRLHPSLPLLLPRESQDSFEVLGYEIPPKTRLIINAWAIGRDPKYWPDAEKFNPQRFLNSYHRRGTNFEYIPFGAGRKACPGIYFALANTELLLAQLLYHFDWNLPDGVEQEELNMTEATGLRVRRKEDLVLVPVPYQSLPVLS